MTNTLHADRFLSMRKRLAELQKVAGRKTLQDVLEAFDRTWRVLRVVRQSLVERALAKDPAARIDESDFASIVGLIYDARPDDWLCGHCGASIDRTVGVCPFCLGSLVERKPTELMTASEWEKAGKSIERPEWDFKFKGIGGNAAPLLALNEQRRAEAAERNAYPEIRPSTQKDLIAGPTGEGGIRRVTAADGKRSRKWERIAAYARKMATRASFPFSDAELAEMNHYDLRTVLAAIPDVPTINWKGLSPLAIREMIVRLQPREPIGPEGWDEPPCGRLPDFIRKKSRKGGADVHA